MLFFAPVSRFAPKCDFIAPEVFAVLNVFAEVWYGLSWSMPIAQEDQIKCNQTGIRFLLNLMWRQYTKFYCAKNSIVSSSRLWRLHIEGRYFFFYYTREENIFVVTSVLLFESITIRFKNSIFVRMCSLLWKCIR